MAEQTAEALRVGRAREIFEELRASGKSNEEIFLAVYQDLKLLAHRMLGRQPAGNSMHASRLMSDLWMRKFGKSAAEFDWRDGTHFFNSMAKAMRLLLIDHARHRKAQIRGKGEVVALEGLTEMGFQTPQDPVDTRNRNWIQEKADQTLVLEQSFRLLEADKPRQATVVELRVYGGLSEAETAEILGMSPDAVAKDFARAKRRLAYYLKTAENDTHSTLPCPARGEQEKSPPEG